MFLGSGDHSVGGTGSVRRADRIFDGTRSRFDQILKEQWKKNLDRMSAEHFPTDAFYGPGWGGDRK